MKKKLFVTILLSTTVSYSAANASIAICQSLPSSLNENIESWQDISQKGSSIISEIDKLASNVNGILKMEDDLKSIDKQLLDAKKIFDTFIPIVGSVSSIKNVFTTASNTLGTISSKGVAPSKAVVTNIATQSGVRATQEELDQQVKPKLRNMVDFADDQIARLNEKLESINSACQTLAAASCVTGQSLDQISELSEPAVLLLNNATSKQQVYFEMEVSVNNALVKTNKALDFSNDLSKEISQIKKPISDIVGSVNKVGDIMNKKINIKISTFKEKFTVKQAFNKVGDIIKTVQKLPGVKDVAKKVNKPIEEVMDEVTKPINIALKPLTKGLKVPSFNQNDFSMGSLPDFSPPGPQGFGDSLADLDSLMLPLLNSCQ